MRKQIRIIIRFIKQAVNEWFPSRQKPVVIQMPITSRCNSRCATCNVWKHHQKIDIDDEYLKECLKDPFFSEVKSVGINGGEFSLVPRFKEIIDALTSLPMKDLLPEEPILEEDDDVTWEFDATVNGNDARYNIEINFVVIQGGSYISIHLQVRDLYDISLEATMGGSVTLSMGGHIYTSNTATVIAGDNLILSAESDLNYNFVGWYIDNTWIASSNPYTYTMPAQDVVVQGKFERQAVQMTDSYKLGRSVFQSATGVTLPEIENIEGDIFFDGDSVMFDIVSGENLSKDTYDDILAYLDELDGWTGVDATQSEEYPTKTYTNSTTGASFQVVWNGESVEGGIYLNTISALTYDAYSATRTYLATLFGLVLPEMASTEFAVNISFSCGADLSYMTLDMEKTTNFTQEEYNTFVMMLSELGDGVDVGEEGFNKKVEWTLDDIIEGELYLTIEWDLATTIAINISEIVDNTK